MTKKIRYMLVSAALFLALSACGRKGGPSTAASQHDVQDLPATSASKDGVSSTAVGQPEDQLAAAEQGFRQAFSKLSGVHSDLRQEISAAEVLLEAVAEEDVADTAVLSDLRTALEEAKSIPSLTGLEMGDTLEEIRQQGQRLSEQTDKIKGLYDGLRSAVSRVEESQRAKCGPRWAFSFRAGKSRAATCFL